jgi:hypothetical protein
MTEDQILEIVTDFLNALEAACVDAKRQISEVVNVSEKRAATVPEQTTFNILKMETQKGSTLGDFETAEKKNNIEQNWTHAYNILKQSNATINARFHGPGYAYSYWLYNEKIYRQKLKTK